MSHQTEEPQKDTQQSDSSDPVLPPDQVERAVRLSYAQAMLGSIYMASTGGMFIIGYALKLGANNVQIGLMSTIPMLCVVVQLVSSMVIERGVSRRRMTIYAGAFNVSCWALVILLPQIAAKAPTDVRIGALIAIVSLVTMFAFVSGNARASWVGDLIPADCRGMFFGRMIMYAGIIGAVFAILEGTVLDHLKQMGISAFNWLFVFGMIFGLLNVILFAPQPDVTRARNASDSFWLMVKETFANRPLMMVMAYGMIWSLQLVAGPFYVTYMLRDLKIPYLGLGILNGVAIITMLVSSPFWGRVVDRYGCRPVLIACTLVLAPTPLVWIWLTHARAVYAVIPPLNLLGGFAIAGISVALSTLIYKVTPSAGRAVQFAVYSVLVVLLAAPMPTLGGHLPDWLRAAGLSADLRATFYVTVVFLLGAGFVARRISEDGARPARELVRNLPCHLVHPRSLKPED
jgi:MFS family permease